MKMKTVNLMPDILLQKAEELETYYKKHYPALAPMVRQCFLNTMETTIKQLDDGSYFVITGDIEAMWLRDSASQVRTYVQYAKYDAKLANILEGVILKQAELIGIDPYANAFNESANGRGHKDITQENAAVWERKFEVDSLCAPLYLAYNYWKTTGNTGVFGVTFKNMLYRILEVFEREQDHSGSPYTFIRENGKQKDTLPAHGKGRPVNITGMVWSGFRPSDDSCRFGYLLPSNMMAVKALTYAKEITQEVYKEEMLAKRCQELAYNIEQGILDYGIVDHPRYGKIYTYEADGFGNFNLMDDANSPSLLAIPYIEYRDKDDVIYQNTRKFALSSDNPYYFSGKYAEGIGSPHTKTGYVWHIGIIIRALTSDSREEIMECLEMLAMTHAGTNFMHEAFDPNEPQNFTRHWFAWANALFSELLLHLMDQRFF